MPDSVLYDIMTIKTHILFCFNYVRIADLRLRTLMGKAQPVQKSLIESNLLRTIIFSVERKCKHKIKTKWSKYKQIGRKKKRGIKKTRE